MGELLIVGGGAAGLAAAITAARRDPAMEITILEGKERLGKKLLSTGNGKCNLTNDHISLEHYHSGDSADLACFLDKMPEQRTLDFFRDMGLYTSSDEAGRVYPYCRQAAMVQELLILNTARYGNIHTVLGTRVTELRQVPGGFAAETQEGRRYEAARVILTTGGQAAPKLGSDGSGYDLARGLGHSVTPLRPCLVPLKCKGEFFRELKGVRCHGAVALYRGKTLLAQDRGELQFTDYGLSGIPVFQLSCHLTGVAEIRVDLLPEITGEQLFAELRERLRRNAAESVEDAMLGLIHRKLQYVILKRLGISPTGSARGVSHETLSRLVNAIKDWRIPVMGTASWDQAQVTGGGVPLTEVGEDFQSRCCPGLYLAGELLDVVGDCGGYNLHWAWCSGIITGEAAAKA